MFGLILMTVLAAMGGAIAFIGDNVGTKVGKRKLSLFGLRPKHTSIVIAVSTGILIATSTLTVLTLVSRDVQTALFGMDKLRTELMALSIELAQKNEQLEASQVLLKEKEQAYATLISSTDAMTNQLLSTKLQLNDVLEQHEQTMEALGEIQGDYNQALSDLDKAKSDIMVLSATKRSLSIRIDELIEAREALEYDVNSLNETTAKLNAGIKYLRENSVIYRVNEVLATIVIDPTTGQAQDELIRIVAETNRKILQRTGKQGSDVKILGVSQEDFQKASKALKNSKNSMVVRVVAHRNTVKDEPVIAHLELYPNKHIFTKGETIIRKALDLDHNRDDIESTILQLLQQVNRIAVEKGVLPDPLRGTVGSISGAEFFAVVNQLKNQSGIVQLNVIADSDTSVAGPLKIKIVVEHV